jgi:hypothetical protein
MLIVAPSPPLETHKHENVEYKMRNYLTIITLATHCGWLIKNNHSFLHAFLEGIVTYAYLLT